MEREMGADVREGNVAFSPIFKVFNFFTSTYFTLQSISPHSIYFFEVLICTFLLKDLAWLYAYNFPV